MIKICEIMSECSNGFAMLELRKVGFEMISRAEGFFYLYNQGDSYVLLLNPDVQQVKGYKKTFFGEQFVENPRSLMMAEPLHAEELFRKGEITDMPRRPKLIAESLQKYLLEVMKGLERYSGIGGHSHLYETFYNPEIKPRTIKFV